MKKLRNVMRKCMASLLVLCMAAAPWTCKYPKCKGIPIFKGTTHPHCCPLVGGKKYVIHKNLGSGTDGLMRDVMTDYYHG